MPARLHELAHRIAALSDITEIVAAMRSLAFVELRRLLETIAHQQETLAARERAIADLLAHFPQPLSEPTDGGEVCLALGSEWGFCGDFNTTVAAAVAVAGDGCECRLLVVGARLASILTDEGMTHQALGGATVSEEVPRVLQQIAAVLSADGPDGVHTSGLVVLHHDSDGALARVRLLPSPSPPRQPEPRTVLQLHLPPRELFQALMDQYLLSRLNAALLASLHAENHRRLEHTGAAIERLNRELDSVQRQRRRARQEAITEEIEIMLLGAHGSPRHGFPA